MHITQPWRRIKTVQAINLEELKALGVRLILIDRDNTCVPRDTYICSDEVRRWFDAAHALNFKICLVSNNFHSDQIQQTASYLGCPKIDHAMKPAPFALKYAMKRFGVAPQQTVMIGDQYFTDVVSGNLAGVKTILVEPLSEVDLWYTKIFRNFEMRLFGHPSFEE